MAWWRLDGWCLFWYLSLCIYYVLLNKFQAICKINWWAYDCTNDVLFANRNIKTLLYRSWSTEFLYSSDKSRSKWIWTYWRPCLLCMPTCIQPDVWKCNPQQSQAVLFWFRRQIARNFLDRCQSGWQGDTTRQWMAGSRRGRRWRRNKPGNESIRERLQFPCAVSLFREIIIRLCVRTIPAPCTSMHAWLTWIYVLLRSFAVLP